MGGGNSFGDVFLPHRQHVIDTSRLNQILHSDPDTGRTVVQCGVRSGTLSASLLAHGRYLPGSAGSLTNTVAGDVGSNVNGKDSWKFGSYASNVTSFKLMLANGETVHVDRKTPGLFWAVMGGLGMLGIVTEVELSTSEAKSAHLHVESEVTRNLSDTIRAFAALKDDEWDFAYAWVDALGTTATLGRGIIEKARFESDRRFRSLPNDFATKKSILGLRDDDFWVIYRGVQRVLRGMRCDREVAQLVNALHYYRVRYAGSSRSGVPLTTYQYPMLKALPNWNKGISELGMQEVQLLFREDIFEEAFLEVMSIMKKHRVYPLICAIRKHRPDEGLLSFSGDGLSFTVNYDRVSLLDTETCNRLERELMAAAIRHSGKVYLSKFPYMTPDECAAMYPAISRFKSLKSALDPGNLLASATSARILGK